MHWKNLIPFSRSSSSIFRYSLRNCCSSAVSLIVFKFKMASPPSLPPSTGCFVSATSVSDTYLFVLSSDSNLTPAVRCLVCSKVFVGCSLCSMTAEYALMSVCLGRPVTGDALPTMRIILSSESNSEVRTLITDSAVVSDFGLY